jgi:hypothetical protein
MKSTTVMRMANVPVKVFSLRQKLGQKAKREPKFLNTSISSSSA